MKNLRRLALVSSIAALGAVAFNPKAQAETADVTFSGNIPMSCSFSSTTGGSLVSSGGWVEAAGNSVPGLDTGTSGSTTLSCNGSATVSPSAPIKVSAPDAFDGSNAQSIIYIAENADGNRIVSSYSGSAPWQEYASNNSNAIPIPANTSRVLKVGMTAGSGNGTVVPGSYNYKVTVTATAN
ncbi:hypothetical protein MEN41_02940 [Dolichospermum sp. ST_con]|nr:hypothetical protein [Dolichospermum sp. ST_con]MDD1420020.1 hypothetical protein [Dolichospermum sp. ST_sed1]MDD1423961.1 hypothetical protein [Dolichospermum sp. ST_sed9]MDD1432126.1 hypothetical protein [Dolichospermum sp. ST_sed6]MDD1440085.1 hypothetical protein [Dolichospermum sp. ST_sed3]MDD1445934.1 hypothetical protein [Dolichospermum sp. ST_sed8]MDD1455786.1 hypothetical protein [Dolichospermum sp. ST_sed7]MDD1461475.1 hypothetical protein [Dolichospermum sp. ST_sed2]MDD1463849